MKKSCSGTRKKFSRNFSKSLKTFRNFWFLMVFSCFSAYFAQFFSLHAHKEDAGQEGNIMKINEKSMKIMKNHEKSCLDMSRNSKNILSKSLKLFENFWIFLVSMCFSCFSHFVALRGVCWRLEEYPKAWKSPKSMLKLPVENPSKIM